MQEMDLSQLNNDISFNILSRVPANMLVQLKIVSKGWQRVISDLDFTQIQMKRAKPVSISGFFFQERFEYCDIDVENLSYIPVGTNQTKIYQNILAFLPEKVVILVSSNGLLCCRSCIPSINPTIYICNPVNKEWMTVKWEKIKRCDFITFSFDPYSVSSFNVTKGYRLVRVIEVDDLTSEKEQLYFSFEMYDWEREQWMRSKELCYCEDSLCANKQLISKGILYWLTDACQILSFDIENQISLLISLPLPLTEGYSSEICLGESDGELHCIMVSEDSILVWALVDEFSSKWDLKVSIPFKLIEQWNPEFVCNLVERVAKTLAAKDPWLHPLAFKDGLLFLRISNSAYTFRIDNISNLKLRWLCNMVDLGPNSYIGPTVLPYSMSLATVANA